MNIGQCLVVVCLAAVSGCAEMPRSASVGADPSKFHIYLLAGQSNMAGRGELTPSNRVSSVRILKMDKSGAWAPAEEPLHFDVPSIAGAGLGASFARAMADAEPDVTIGLVPCALGGSPMWRWDPGAMCYTNTVARAKAAMKVGTLKGILWHQGCSEADVKTNAFGHAERVAKMMASFRKDLGAPDVPIVAGELGWFLDDVIGYKPSKYWRQVNKEINRLPQLLKSCAAVSSEGLTANEDGLHFNTPSQRAFGLRYAKAMRQLQKGGVRIGVIGCDTSHAVEFAENPAFNVVCAYKWGSKDIFSSTNRYPAYIRRMRELGVTMVESIPELLAKCDAVLLETNDGRPHLEQAREVFKSGKPVFIDKPLAGSWDDCLAIYEAAKGSKATFFSGSALHYNSNAVAVVRGDFGKVRSAVAWSPDSFEPTQQEYFWYGVHGVELLFGALGPGCEKVSCVRTKEGDVLTGVWNDGRMGVVKLNNVAVKVNAGGFGGYAFTEKGEIDLGGWESYQGLENDILAYFRTGKPPRTMEEQLEIYAFMEAACRSQAQDGISVRLPGGVSGPFADEAGFTSLFNGKDLSGWEGATDTYCVSPEGYLTCTQRDGIGESGAKNLWTVRDYTNFVIRFEVKLPPNANNGLGIRTPANGWCSREGMELQLLDDRGDDYNGSNKLVSAHYTGSVYGVVPPANRLNGESYLNPPNEWNSVEVTADGPHIVFVLNGVTIVDTDVSKFSTDGTVPADGIKRPGLHNKTGRIHWCGHGHNIFWRDIRIKELP